MIGPVRAISGQWMLDRVREWWLLLFGVEWECHSDCGQGSEQRARDSQHMVEAGAVSRFPFEVMRVFSTCVQISRPERKVAVIKLNLTHSLDKRPYANLQS